MARLLSLIVCAVVAGTSWSVGRAFVSSLPSTCRRQRATTTTQMRARGGGGAQTVVVPEEATSTDGGPAALASPKITQTADELVTAAKEVSGTKAVAKKASKSKKASTGGKLSQVGIFSPIVEAAKAVLGEEELANFRGEAIKAHTAVITAFAASLTPEPDAGYTDSQSFHYFGESAVRNMFKLADADGNGSVDVEEVRSVVKTLGFKWLDDDSKISQIIDKMDKNGDEMIDLEEFMAKAPVVFRQNLVKLAKTNGNDMGLLV